MVKVSVVGATGAVGREILKVLEALEFPAQALSIYASSRSVGEKISYQDQILEVQAVPKDAQLQGEIALLSAGSAFSRVWSPRFAANNITVIDNSSAWRYEAGVPLIVPEVNAKALQKHQGIIANPNCTTIILSVALYPLHVTYRAKQVIVSTYQAASGAGAAAIQELRWGSESFLAGQTVSCEVFQKPLAFNVIPHVDSFQENGYTREEMKVTWETQKIFSDPDLRLSCTSVRVPTFRAHAEAISVCFDQEVSPQEARVLLRASHGVQVLDDPARSCYPMPLTASEQWDVQVGRVRQSLVFGENGLDFFVVGDQLLKGAALNAVQIMQCLASAR